MNLLRMTVGKCTFHVNQTGVNEATRKPEYSVDIEQYKQPWAKGCSERDVEHLTRLTHAVTSSRAETQDVESLGRKLEGWSRDFGVTMERPAFRCGSFSALPRDVGGSLMLDIRRDGKPLGLLTAEEARDISDLGRKTNSLFRHLERGEELEVWVRAERVQDHANGKAVEPERDRTR